VRLIAPIREGAINGIVICHNVIQHTPLVEDTARALWRLVGPGGEFVFHCYPKNDLGVIRKVRLGVYYALRAILPRCPFWLRLKYAQTMSVSRFVPVDDEIRTLIAELREVLNFDTYFLRPQAIGIALRLQR
jgi:SAM-dependent methyltransferase